MLNFCGKRFRVLSRADKTCDTIDAAGFRKMEDAVHLDQLRCDGAAHGGCQAGCLLFWKETWLKKVDDETAIESDRGSTPLLPGNDIPVRLRSKPTHTKEDLLGATRGGNDGVFVCQATELKKATTRLAWWDVRQYVRDLRSGNVQLPRLIRGLLIMLFNKFQAANHHFLHQLPLVRGARKYPFVEGRLAKTPSLTLNLQPGELVRTKSKEEIEGTLDVNNKNRGLSFDREMLRYCGRTARVLRRVEKIIDERTGEMIHLPNACIILDGVVCCGDFNQFCPRRIYSFWREIWLERIEPSRP
jgi:hypothetical protein